MTENEAKSFMLIEKECINRDCNRDCAKCDIVQAVDNLNNAYDTAIKALEEVQQYRAIGTPEECRAAMERQNPRAAITEKEDTGTTRYICPTCGMYMGWSTGTFPARYCWKCGQKLDWGDEE